MQKLQFVLNPNTGKEEILKGLFQHCSTKSGIKFSCDQYMDNETEEVNFFLTFNTPSECKVFMFEFFFALNVPDHEFTEITKSDFCIQAYDQNMINFINTQLQRSMQYDIELLDYVCSDLALDQTQTNERLDSVENYIHKSGIIHYQQFMKELIEVLDAKDILDKDSILQKMFQTTH